MKKHKEAADSQPYALSPDHLIHFPGKLLWARACNMIPPAERQSSQGPEKEQHASATPTLKFIFGHFDIFFHVLSD